MKSTLEKNPLVSIIIPMYNVEKYITENLISIKKQTYTNYEVIIINDNSSDGSLKEVQQFLEKNHDFFPKVKIINFDKNFGPSKCRNIGIEISLGEYIYFLDSDDLMHHDLLKKSIGIFNMHRNLDLLTFKANFFNEFNTSIIHTGFLLPKYEKTYNRDDFLMHTFKQRNTAVWMNMYRKSFLINKDLTFYEGIFYEDALFTERVICNMNEIYCFEDIMINHRINSTSITQHIKDEEFRIFSYSKVLEETNKIIKSEDSDIIKKYLDYQQSITLTEIFKFSSVSITNFFKTKHLYSVKGGYKFYLRILKIFCLKFMNKNK